MRTAIVGGTVVTSDHAQLADVIIEDEMVVGVVQPGAGLLDSYLPSCDEVLDATGKYVIPGGIDAHTHLGSIGQGSYVLDSFETGTIAAARGGTTTVIDFASPEPGAGMRSGVDDYHRKAAGNTAIDYGFHVFLVGSSPETLHEMDRLIDEGITSFKMFMAYPGSLYSNDGEILQAMQRSATNGALVMMHAENGIAIDVLREQAAQQGRVAPINHALTRPAVLEAEAVHRAAVFARLARVPLYIVHLSSTDALEQLKNERHLGHNVFAETCPQYLFLDESYLALDGLEGAKYVCSPPLRPRDHQQDIWRGLAEDHLQVVATDHCPFCTWQRELGRDDFRLIPNGLGGIEHRVELMFTGVTLGHLSLSRWVDIVATGPARMFGMFPRKGTIAPGADADIVLFNPCRPHTISVESHLMNVDYSVYEGREVPGSVDTVLLRGRVIVRDRVWVGSRGDGRFIPRGLCQHIR